MTHSTTHPFSIMAYWQRGLWQSAFNHFSLTLNKICDHHWLPATTMAQGNVAELTIQGEQNVWLAPWVFYQPTLENQIMVPIWLPARLRTNQLMLRENNFLPWIPPILLDTLTSTSIFAGQTDIFDDWLRHDSKKEEQLIWPDWVAFYQDIRLLLAKLAGGDIIALLKEQGWLLHEKAILITETALQQLVEWPPSASPLLAQFAEITETTPKLVLTEEQLADYAHLICGAFSALPLTSKESIALMQTLSLQENELVAIKAPVGCRKATFLSTLAATYLVTSALENKSPLNLVLLCPTSLTQRDFPITQPANSQITLSQCYANFVQGITLAKQFWQQTVPLYDDEPADFGAYIESLKEQDENYEKQLTLFQQVQQKFRQKFMPQSTWSKLQNLLITKGKQDQAMKELLAPLGEQFTALPANIDEKISDNIRQLKVWRTKIHQELVERIEKNTNRLGDERRWLLWVTEHLGLNKPLLNLNQALAMMQAHFGPLLLQLSHQVGTSINKVDGLAINFLQGWFLYQFDSKALRWQVITTMPEAQLLIIDQAHRLLAQQVAPLLNQAKQAVFLGDNQDLLALPSITPAQEAYLFAEQAIDDEELLDQLQYKGLLNSAGNAFQSASANSSYQTYDEATTLFNSKLTLQEENEPLLAVFQKGEYSSHLLVNPQSSFAGFHFIPATGKSKKLGNTLINPAEAKKIATWLKAQSPPAIASDWVIVTPFYQQKVLIEEILAAEQLDCRVLTCLELPERQWHYVIFSPVYSVGDARPFIFDQGENLLASVIGRATTGVWVIGDKAIFDLKMHSPSGKLAKLFLPPKRKAKAVKQPI